jgi:hypothetical protein
METVQYQKILLIVLLSVWSIGNIFANLNVYFGDPDDKEEVNIWDLKEADNE